MAAIVLGQVRGHPPRRVSRGVPRAGPAPAARVSQCCRQVAPHRGAHAPQRAGSAGGLEDQGLPGGSPPSLHTPGTGEIFSSGLGDGDLGRAGGGGRCGRAGERCRGRPLPAASPQGRRRRPGRGRCGCENPERWIERARNSSAVRPRAGHAQCGRRAAVRQLGSSRSRAVGARTPAAASRVACHLHTVANFAASPELARPILIPYK